MMPLAPPRFSITNGWPNDWASLSAHGRPMRSVAPPGAQGKMSLTGRSGHSPARAKEPAISVEAVKLRNSQRRMLLRAFSTIDGDINANIRGDRGPRQPGDWPTRRARGGLGAKLESGYGCRRHRRLAGGMVSRLPQLALHVSLPRQH